jgi:uncharacterized membrane protein
MLVLSLQFAALFLLALVTGIFWGPWFALHRSMSGFSATEFLHITRTMVRNLGIPMRILMPCCIVAMGASTWSYPDRQCVGFYFSIAALVLSIIALVVTMAVEVPIVTRIDRWTDTTIPDGWQSLRDRWLSFHIIRVVSSVCSFACLVIALLYLVK